MKWCKCLLYACCAIVLSVPAARADLLVSSNASNQILRYNQATGAFLNTFASVSSPLGLAYGPDNNLYVASGNTILRLNGFTGALLGTYATFASGSIAHDLVFDAAGNLYATIQGGSQNNTIQKIPPGGGSSTSFGAGPFTNPEGLAIDATNLYVVSGSNPSNTQVLQVNLTTGATSTFVAAPAGELYDITLGPDGNSDGVQDLYGSVRTGAGVQANNTVHFWRGPGGSMPGTSLGTYATNVTSPKGIAFRHDNILAISHDPGGTGNDLIRRTTGAPPPPVGGYTAVNYTTGTQPQNPTYILFQPAGIPEPGTLALFGLASGVMGLYAWRCRKSRVRPG